MRTLIPTCAVSSWLLLAAAVGAQQAAAAPAESAAPAKSSSASAPARAVAPPPAPAPASAPAPAAVELRPGVTIRASVDGDGAQGKEMSGLPTLSADGTCVAFSSSVRNFRPGVLGVGSTIFVRELATGRTDRIDVTVDGKQMSTGLVQPAVSADGNLVAMYAVQEMAPQDACIEDIVLFDRRSRAITRVNPAAQGIAAPLGPYPVALAADGSCLVFETTADFARGIRKGGAMLFDVASGKVAALPCGAEAMFSMWASVSADGQCIAFTHMPASSKDPHAAGAYVLDRKACAVQPLFPAAGDAPGRKAGAPQLSVDGRFVVYVAADDPAVPGDTNGVADVFVRDRKLGRTVRASVATDGTQADAASNWASISVDGRRVVFSSKATNLVPGDTNGVEDVFVRELAREE